MQKIIFLDIDGVLTSGNNFILSRDKFQIIADLCKTSGIRLVLSSSWRNFEWANTVKELSSGSNAELFNIIIPYIVGITPRNYHLSRGGEIELFLDYIKTGAFPHLYDTGYFNGEDIDYIIVDDAEVEPYQYSHHIKTDMFTGLEEEHIIKIVKYFN